MLRQMKEGVPVCVTVTLLDGLVLARSIFNHSMNYRSVVILGKATLVDDPDEKLQALRLLSEHIIPGRWADSRQPNERELKATSVLRLPIEEFSAKVRTGPVIDDEEDYSFPTWAGVVPLEIKAGTPINDSRLLQGLTVPEYAEKIVARKDDHSSRMIPNVPPTRAVPSFARQNTRGRLSPHGAAKLRRQQELARRLTSFQIPVRPLRLRQRVDMFDAKFELA